MVAYLAAQLDDVQRLDLVTTGAGDGQEMRQSDIPFISGSTAVLISPGMDMLRAMPATTLQMRLLAIADHAERVPGEYTFHHSPHLS